MVAITRFDSLLFDCLIRVLKQRILLQAHLHFKSHNYCLQKLVLVQQQQALKLEYHLIALLPNRHHFDNMALD